MLFRYCYQFLWCAFYTWIWYQHRRYRSELINPFEWVLDVTSWYTSFSLLDSQLNFLVISYFFLITPRFNRFCFMQIFCLESCNYNMNFWFHIRDENFLNNEYHITNVNSALMLLLVMLEVLLLKYIFVSVRLKLLMIGLSVQV